MGAPTSKEKKIKRLEKQIKKFVQNEKMALNLQHRIDSLTDKKRKR